MAEISIDTLGCVYTSLAIAWTIILSSAMAFLFAHRDSPFLRIRRLPLFFTSLIVLHIYWTLSMIFYVIGPAVPCAVEYFIMSVYLPFGIALFQAANSQLLSVATRQEAFVRKCYGDDAASTIRSCGLRRESSVRGYLTRFRRADKVTQTTAWISVSLAVQILLTVLVYVASEKFHASSSIVLTHNDGTDIGARAACSRGWEWFLSIVWQFFWTWLYAPWLLFKTRHIKDTHGWRLQTILCCISGLPATPLWLAALYSPDIASVNKVFPPSMWLAISIFFMQLFSVSIPCWQVFTHRSLQQDTLDVIASWEQRNKKSNSVDSIASTKVATPTDSTQSFQTLTNLESNSQRLSCSSTKDTMLTMAALDHALRWDPEPLQRFAALKDFSGENVSFLTHLSEWKQSWKCDSAISPLANTTANIDLKLQTKPYSTTSTPETDAKKRRQQFNKALHIYAAFINMRTAEFPISLASPHLNALDSIFDRAATLLYGTPGSSASTTSNPPTAGIEVAPFAHPDDTDKAAMVTLTELNSTVDAVWYWGPIPQNFNESVFEAAEREVRYSVLTNTWPKFVGGDEVKMKEEGRKDGGIGWDLRRGLKSCVKVFAVRVDEIP